MYKVRNRSELFDSMATYVGYAPNFSDYRFFKSNEEAELELYDSISTVFSIDHPTRDRLLEAARRAFASFRDGNLDDGYKNFKIIIDELY